MKRFIYIALLGLFGTVACQETEFGPKQSPENGVTELSFFSQSVPCEIAMVPAEETAEKNTVKVFLLPGTDYSDVEVESIEVSAGAVSSLKKGDRLDMNRENEFTVTAADGRVRTFVILKPQKFNHRQGAVITQTIKGEKLSMTVGEWLVLGQNCKWDVDEATQDTVGFYRCVNSSAPVVGGQFVNPIYLRSTADDRDDYFIFRSDGTYEFSAGKDRKSSSIASEYEQYRQYLCPVGKGYWSVVSSKNFDGSNNGTNAGSHNHFAKTDNWGILLTDAITGETFLFGYLYVHLNFIRLQRWPLQSQNLVCQYTFMYSEADADWKQWLVE